MSFDEMIDLTACLQRFLYGIHTWGDFVYIAGPYYGPPYCCLQFRLRDCLQPTACSVKLGACLVAADY